MMDWNAWRWAREDPPTLGETVLATDGKSVYKGRYEPRIGRQSWCVDHVEYQVKVNEAYFVGWDLADANDDNIIEAPAAAFARWMPAAEDPAPAPQLPTLEELGYSVIMPTNSPGFIQALKNEYETYINIHIEKWSRANGTEDATPGEIKAAAQRLIQEAEEMEHGSV